jgi:transcription elongation GreA/GreB family factor
VNINKDDVIQLIIQKLADNLSSAMQAARQAHETATHVENIAENKYDTLGLEASYLAQGQAKRVQSLQQDLTVYKNLYANDHEDDQPVELNNLIKTMKDKEEQWFFLGPCSGGLKINIQDTQMLIITPTTPLGRALLGKHLDDEIKLSVEGKDTTYEILEIR